MNGRMNSGASKPRLKSRAAAAGLTLMLGVGSLVAAPRKVPSSLDKPGATIRFAHSHQRVASCKARARGLGCTEQSVPADASAVLTLTPTADDLVSQPGPQREPAKVALPSRKGFTSVDIRLESGGWALSWADQHELLRVDSQRDFSVQLKTVSGACAVEQDECHRHDEVISRKVVIPPEFQVAH